MNVARKTYKEGAKIMGKRLCLPIGILALTLQFGAVQAATLWDNGLPNGLGGNNMSDTSQADDFNVAVASDLTGIRFWDLEGAADYNGSIFWNIVNNAAGSPGATSFGSGLATPTRVAQGTFLGLTQFQNDFAISIANLAAGTYWLELHNGPLATDGFTDFYWSWTNFNGINTPTNRGSEFALPGGPAWTTNDNEHAFVVFGDPVQGPPGVPEPGTLALMAAGMAVLALRRKNKG